MIDELYPDHIGREADADPEEPSEAHLSEPVRGDAGSVVADEDGYLEFVDGDALLELAIEEDVLVRLERKPGNYVVAGLPLAQVRPPDRITGELEDRVRSLFILGHQRSSSQDIEFGLNHLVEIAVRALSPGINDTFTAITCVDRLGSVLCRLTARDMPAQHRRDDDGRLRVIVRADTFADFTDAAFNRIRQSSRACAAVTIRLLETIAVIAGFAHRQIDRAALLRHAEMIARGAAHGLSEDEDLRTVEACRLAVIRMCADQREQHHGC